MTENILVLMEHLQGKILDISYTMLVAGRVLAKGSSGKLVAVLLGHGAARLASELDADEVAYMDDPQLAEFNPEAYTLALESVLKANPARVCLIGHTSIGMGVASELSVRLGIPLVSQVKTVGEDLTFASQICGGKLWAEGSLPAPTVLVTMVPGGYKPEQGKATSPPSVTEAPAPAFGDLHIRLREYLEPEAGDVDISQQRVLVAVGRGLQNEADLELAQGLADALGGAVCGSRPVVDQGWLPTSRLVGKSGLSVKPDIYLAFGISGAPEHVEGMSGSRIIVAVNTDPNAPIFEVAQYGAEVDLYDILPAMIETAQKVAG